MIAPTLLVGLGGTGSKIVSRVSKMVTEEQRKHIGFAVFDTDINELREIREANPYIKTIQTSTKLTVGEYLNIDTHARDTWFPVNGILNSKSLTEGAGQVRAISRLALDTAIRAGNMEPLHKAIEELYKLEGDSGEQALRVVIVSSLAGGTGSGLILPVALYLKNYLATKFQASANITRGFFILPEVFYEVIRGQSERNNLRCNAYAALRELDAFLMKGDKTLPEKYDKTVRVEFPRVGSSEVEEYDVRPYDFCFLFDAQNTEGKKLNSFNQYLDHAANCIYSQSIGPMNKRSNSSEDNTIRELCAQRGRNRYAGAGSAMLIYPTEDVKEYIALNWAKECVSKQWMVFDDMYRERCMANSEMRAQGFHVCASANCFNRLLKEMPYTGNTITIDKELAEDIYSKVRGYSMMKDKPENGGYFEELFEDGIIGYFEKSLMEIYGTTVNMDVLSALEREAKYEANEYDYGRIEQYVRRVIAETRSLSNPFIERPLGEQREPIAACTYSKQLDPKDDSPRSMLIAQELGNYGGNPDEDIPLNMIMFYQAIYGLRANGLSKFAPGSEADGRCEGEYYKAYYELISQIKPKSDKTPVITPHIDRKWHIITCLPDLDDENQERQERRIYRAFILGMIFNLISYRKIAEGKYLYRLQLNGIDTEEFVVSNGTPCDHYYEVLDALIINPVVVKTILNYMDKKFTAEKNSAGKITIENSLLMKHIGKLKTDEFKKSGLTIFDLALLLKVSTPAAEFDKKVGKDIMRESLQMIYEYMSTIVLGDDLDWIYGNFVFDQVKAFDKNVDWYFANWRDDFSDYVDDLMQIAANELENKEQENLCEKMQELIENARERRE